MTPAELADRLRALPIRPALHAALDDAGAQLAAAVRAELSDADAAHDTPWPRSGALRDSIGHQADDAGAQVGSTSDVAVFQENGTARMPPRPFLLPAAVAQGHALAAQIGAALAGLIGEATRR
jgi:HK97 gp10 family phage protein